MKKNTFNRICAAILAIVTVFLLIPAGVLPTFAETPKIWNGTVASGFASGTGTESDPYIIKTAEQLAYLAKSVNDGTTYEGEYFKLGNDIVLNDTSNWEKWDTTAPKNTWTAIGRYSSKYPFSGTFDGDGHTVSGIYVYMEADVQGLFGYANNAVIKNLGVEKSYIKGGDGVGGVVGYNSYNGTVINCYNTGEVSGVADVGGVVGAIGNGMVSDCYNTGTVSGGRYVGGVVGENIGGTISGCYNTGEVSGNIFVGGVVGINCYGTVSDCYNTGTVSGGRYVGGVVGESNGDPDTATVSNCYNTGEVSGVDDCVGGVVGESAFGTVSNCYNTGEVIGEGNAVGGVVGRNGNGSTVSNCYNTGTVSGCGVCVGGVAGENYNGTVINCYNTGEAIGESYNVGGVVGGGYGTVRNCYYLSGCAKDGNGTVQYGIGNEAMGRTTADVSGQTTGLTNTQMKQKKSFVGFDFETVWTMDGNPEYSNPELKDVPMVVPTGVKGDINGDDNIDAFDYQMQGGKKMKKIILVAIALVVVAACITVVTVASRRKR